MKRFGQLLMVALFATAAWTTSANAAAVFYTNCKVSIADMALPTLVVMNVSDLSSPPAFTGLWTFSVSPVPNQMLAIALTAISIGNQVYCEVDKDSTPPVITRLVLTDTPLP